jgi:hypothetical protein
VRSVRRFTAVMLPRPETQDPAPYQFNAISDCVKVIGILTFLVFAACYAQCFLRAQAFSFRTRALA